MSNTATGGVGFSGLLFLIFLTLKLTGTITWSWWWITAPFWGGIALFMLCSFAAAAIFCLAAYLDNKKKK